MSVHQDVCPSTVFIFFCFCSTQAYGNGGGMLCYASSIRILNSVFSDNRAGAAGGGAILLSGSTGITIRESYFESNTASVYAGLAIEGHHNVVLSDTIVKFNNATTSHGGGLSVMNGETITFVNCSIHHNAAATYGGGLLMSATSSVAVNNSFVYFNTAGTNGGGMHVTDSSKIKFFLTLLGQNRAVLSGGGAYFSAVEALELEDCSLASNLAKNESGGGVFAQSTALTMKGNTFRMNAAPCGGGGAIYWVRGSGMLEPNGTDNSSNIFERNWAVYGQSWATESSQLVLNDQNSYYIDDYESSPQVVARLHDYYGQHVPLDSSDDVVALLNADPDSPLSCDGAVGYLTGTINVGFKKGVANFSAFTAYCVPGGNFSMMVSHVITSVGVKSRFFSVTLLQFRKCVRGEYYGDRACHKCELGTYSFTTSDNNQDLKQSICKPCPDNALSCIGDEIHLERGYWRVHQDTDEILACPWGDRGCQGGTMVGDDLCGTGYEGPLCAVCAEGYHFTRSTQTCEPCEKSSSWLDSYSSLVAMFFILVLCAVGAYLFKSRVMDRENLSSLDDVLVYMAVCLHIVDAKLYYRNKEKLSRYTKENRRRFSTRVRIYIAFYQIISVVPFVLDLEFPNVYTIVVSFLGAIVNFNVSTSTVVTCSFDSNYDFIDMLYVDICTPIVITSILKLISMVHLHIKAKKWIRKNDDDMKNKLNRIRSYYFLTFLLYSYMCK
jgi:hypothetical protein